MKPLLRSLLLCFILCATCNFASYQCDDRIQALNEESLNYFPLKIKGGKENFSFSKQRPGRIPIVTTKDLMDGLADSFEPVLELIILLFPLINACFLLRIMQVVIDTYIPLDDKWNPRVFNLTTAFFGFLTIFNHNERNLIVALSALFLAFCQLNLLRYQPGKNLTPIYIVTGILALTPIFLNEYLIHVSGFFEKSRQRSILMVFAMKLITLVVNIATTEPSEAIPEPEPLDKALNHLAYFVHPASCLIPHWHRPRLAEIRTQANQIPLLKVQMRKYSVYLFQAFSIFAAAQVLIRIGNLIVHVQNYPSPSGMEILFIALRFRCAHYFMCYLASGMISLFSTKIDDPTCRIGPIEMPRSLVDVAINWNIPMHNWLKIHVFKPVKSRFGSAALALLVTYSFSALLHGFKFHVWSVMLTVAYLTYVEYKLRELLAVKLSACVRAHKCSYKRQKCKLKHQRTFYNSFLAEFINMAFTLMAMLHLAFLGCIFSGDSEIATYKDAIGLWSKLSFYSHLMGAATHIVYLILLMRS